MYTSNNQSIHLTFPKTVYTQAMKKVHAQRCPSGQHKFIMVEMENENAVEAYYAMLCCNQK